MVECSTCGTRNPAGFNYCAQCGAKMPGYQPTGDTTHVIPLVDEDSHGPDLSEATAAAVGALEVGKALLVVTRGRQADERYLLDQESTMAGRASDCDIFLDDITVSRHHALFTLRDGVVTVEDQGSLNGTYVNRELVESPAALTPGDEVQIGKFRMVLYANDAGRP